MMDTAGKAYANRRRRDDRPEGDYYPTPRSLMWVAEDVFGRWFDKGATVLDPCCGAHVMADELRKFGYSVVENDICLEGGMDYLQGQWNETQVVMNPPFSLWDDFVFKAKTHADAIVSIGRLNYLSTHSRYASGIWKDLVAVYPFTRYIDYQTELRDDGMFCVGAMATGWFVWKRDAGTPPFLEMLDVQKYATLGNFKKKATRND